MLPSAKYVKAKFHWLDATVMSYEDCAGSNAIDDVGVGVVDTFGVVRLAVLTTCQTNFLPVFTHFKETAPVFTVVPALGQACPGVFGAALVAEKAKGEERSAKPRVDAVKTRADFLREEFMRKTVPASECQH